MTTSTDNCKTSYSWGLVPALLIIIVGRPLASTPRPRFWTELASPHLWLRASRMGSWELDSWEQECSSGVRNHEVSLLPRPAAVD